MEIITYLCDSNDRNRKLDLLIKCIVCQSQFWFFFSRYSVTWVSLSTYITYLHYIPTLPTLRFNVGTWVMYKSKVCIFPVWSLLAESFSCTVLSENNNFKTFHSYRHAVSHKHRTRFQLTTTFVHTIFSNPMDYPTLFAWICFYIFFIESCG